MTAPAPDTGRRVAAWARRGTGRVTAEPLAVAAGLIGQPLATPARRAAALGLDLMLVAVLSSASLVWLAAGVAVLAFFVRMSMLEEGIERRWADAMGAVLLVLALAAAWQGWRVPPEGATPATTAVESGADAVEDAAAVPASAAASAAAARLARLEQRVQELEAEIEKRDARASDWRERLAGGLDELGLGLGWSIVYFSLLPPFWNGYTVGKRLLGLRIVELSGAKLTPLRGLKRYGGYVAGMATGGLGFAQVLWEPNRQALHDKAAHTVVLDTRSPREETPACKPPSTNA